MILIHLLNMLIAIMGESFAKNNQVAYKKKKDHFIKTVQLLAGLVV